MSTDHALFLLAASLLFIGLTSLDIGAEKNDFFERTHYFILALAVLLGICSFTFALAGFKLTLRNINVFLYCLIWITLIAAFRLCGKAGLALFTKPTFSKKTAFVLLTSHLAAIAAGLMVFSPDLLPSSMTGDPARHFLGVVELADTNNAQAFKPIYTVSALLFIKTFSGIAQDEAFVIFNILILGLCTSSCMLFFLRLFPTVGFWQILLLAPLICFSYPVFSLLFGYYTLLLSAAFLFAAMTLAIECKDMNGRNKYFAPAFATLGVALTHSYLLPDALISIIFFGVWISKKQGRTISSELWKLAPIFLGVVIISMLSNALAGYNSPQVYKSHIALQGYVNESFLLNIVPLVPLALVFFLKESDKAPVQILAIYVCSTLIFTLLMGALNKIDIAAPYYINRNQLALIPLLIIANFGFLTLIESKRPRLALTALSGILLLAFLPYSFPNWNQSLAVAGSFRRLLENDHFVYLENASIIKSSPLQMSAIDREMMRRIGEGKSECISERLSSLPVLGTDHEVNWFYVYTKIYPSLFFRNDGFIEFSNYENNYKLWKHDDQLKYIVVLRHFDYWRKNRISDEIKATASLVCKGDSIYIYRKNEIGITTQKST